MENSKVAQSVFSDWEQHFAAPGESTNTFLLSTLRSRYPAWQVTTTGSKSGLLSYAQAGNATADLDIQNEIYVSTRVASSLKRMARKDSGHIDDKVTFGKYNYTWKGHFFIVYYAEYFENYRTNTKFYILSRREENSSEVGVPKIVDDLIKAATYFNDDTHEEILVFDQQTWVKDKGLYESVQKSSWQDVILSDEMKSTLISDVEGFFDNRDAYKELSVPWKRGIIFHGTPGNGKTISLKALMNALSSRPDPIPTLYVKSLAGCNNNFYAIRSIFITARHSAPCLLIFEDLDSLISDDVKSFFLNEVDGLEDNDGLMMIGSTNYLERLDPGIAKRPSRFDRKYHFALPAKPERIRYCNFWRSKLAGNSKVEFPEELCETIADATEGLSFAYLKEAFVTSLLAIVGAQKVPAKDTQSIPETNGDTGEHDHILLWQVIKKQIETLRAEMEDAEKSKTDAAKNKAKANSEIAA